jgi:uncharacterized membrane protein
VAPLDSVREIPVDIGAVVILIALTNVSVLVPIIRETPLRIVFGLSFALFVPGYVFVSIIFPEASDYHRTDSEDNRLTGAIGVEEVTRQKEPSWPGRSIDMAERFIFSIVTSVAIILIVGVVLDYTSWGFRLVPLLGAVSGLVLIGCGAAVIRRRTIYSERRFRIPYKEWLEVVGLERTELDLRIDLALNVLLVCGVLVAVGGIGYALSTPDSAKTFTEFYILNKNSDGRLVAEEYPQNFTRGEEQSLYVGVGNHQGKQMNYTVVVELQRVAVSGDSLSVIEDRELDRFTTRLAPNETRIYRRTLTPAKVGDRLRLTLLLYREDPPTNPNSDNAYRELHLWVDVSTDDDSQAPRAIKHRP